MMALYLLLALLLILLNAFFVLAEFAAVKARPTQIEALASAGNRKAKTMERIQARLDEYLSVWWVSRWRASDWALWESPLLPSSCFLS
jgi:CBS domain containing-hemolysin-like protein